MFTKDSLNSIETGAGLSTSGAPAELVTALLPYIFGIAGIVLLLNIISSGFKMMTSAGDPKALQGAQAKLTTSLIGTLILFISIWVVKLIFQFLGIEVLVFDVI